MIQQSLAAQVAKILGQEIEMVILNQDFGANQLAIGDGDRFGILTVHSLVAFAVGTVQRFGEDYVVNCIYSNPR